MITKDPLPNHQKIAIFGLGASGIATAKLLSRFNKTIIASDSAPESKRNNFLTKLPPNTTLILENNDPLNATAVITSPALPPHSPQLQNAIKNGLECIAELECAFRATELPILAITGTDGKTTTTTLLAHILNTAGIKNTPSGNIGLPLTQLLLENDDSQALVVETSAFQLPFCPTLKPKILITTNIAEDHSDYFNHDKKAYIEAKKKPIYQLSPQDTLVLNASDPEILSWKSQTKAKIFYYAENINHIPSNATHKAYIQNQKCHFQTPNLKLTLNIEQQPLKSKHNLLNILAAAAAALDFNVHPDSIPTALNSYTLPPHRIQKIKSIDNIDFIDDSKATNPHAAIAGLLASPTPTVLIAGGVDKELDLSNWIQTMKNRLSALILIGELKNRLRHEAIPHLNCPILDADSMQQAVKIAHQYAKKTNAKAVLLSPACSSYDMFEDYTKRGLAFQNAVHNLKKQTTP